MAYGQTIKHCALMLIMSSACAHRMTPAGSRPSAPQGDGNVITREEIKRVSAATAFDVVTFLGTQMLNPPRAQSSTSSQTSPTVFVDADQIGRDLMILKTIPASDIFEIRYIGSADATLRFGPGHTAGAILVKTIAYSQRGAPR
jgi:hypothetical protein